MKLNDVWGYGQLFGFSGLDGVTRYYDDFVGTLTTKKGEIRFELRQWVKIAFPLKGVHFRAEYRTDMNAFAHIPIYTPRKTHCQGF